MTKMERFTWTWWWCVFNFLSSILIRVYDKDNTMMGFKMLLVIVQTVNAIILRNKRWYRSGFPFGVSKEWNSAKDVWPSLWRRERDKTERDVQWVLISACACIVPPGYSRFRRRDALLTVANCFSVFSNFCVASSNCVCAWSKSPSSIDILFCRSFMSSSCCMKQIKLKYYYFTYILFHTYISQLFFCIFKFLYSFL